MGIILQFIRWRLRMRKAEKQGSSKRYVPDYAAPDMARIQSPDPSQIQVTWVGHSTFLIQVAGINILTDPIWSTRATPIKGLGPKRQARPGLTFSNLPKIDIVLISHTHYDHLDRPTVKNLGSSPHYVLPPNLKDWFTKLGMHEVTELPWWSSAQIEGIKITAVPANHWSRRNLWGKSSVGWGGYVIESSSGVIYFVGDTGYNDQYFKEIGKRFPSIDLALIPIGAYYPQEIFGRYHVDPREAVIVHREVEAKKSIGMHWGTFKLTQEPLDEPPILLASEAKKAGLPADAFSTMKIGETRVL